MIFFHYIVFNVVWVDAETPNYICEIGDNAQITDGIFLRFHRDDIDLLRNLCYNV